MEHAPEQAVFSQSGAPGLMLPVLSTFRMASLEYIRMAPLLALSTICGPAKNGFLLQVFRMPCMEAGDGRGGLHPESLGGMH